MNLSVDDRVRSAIERLTLEEVDVIDSTSLTLRRRIEAGWTLSPGASGHVLLAAEQTGGVGQFGRRWFSPRGGLWMTVVLATPHRAGSEAYAAWVAELGARLGEACGSALQGVLDATAPEACVRVRVKPPNDLLLEGPCVDDRQNWGGAKVCGLLTEVIDPWVLVGVGVNVNIPPEAMPGALAYPATSLRIVLKRQTDLPRVRRAMLHAVVAGVLMP